MQGPDDDDKMVGYLPHCTFNLNARAASIDTPLHSCCPLPMSIMSIPMRSLRWRHRRVAKPRREEIWGGKIGWLPWKRPGYTLGVHAARLCSREPACRGRDACRARDHLLGG